MEEIWMYSLIIPGLAVYLFLSYIAWQKAGPFIERHVPKFNEQYPHEVFLSIAFWPIVITFFLIIATIIYWLKYWVKGHQLDNGKMN